MTTATDPALLERGMTATTRAYGDVDAETVKIIRAEQQLNGERWLLVEFLVDGARLVMHPNNLAAVA